MGGNEGLDQITGSHSKNRPEQNRLVKRHGVVAKMSLHKTQVGLLKKHYIVGMIDRVLGPSLYSRR